MSRLTPPRRRITQRVARLLLYGVCALVGGGVTFGVKAQFVRPLEVIEHDEQAVSATEIDLSPPWVRIAVAIQSEKYDHALRLSKEYRDDSPDEHKLLYGEALSYEGLGEWSDALKRYSLLTADTAPDRVRLVAQFGIARCQLARGDETAARLTLDSCESLSHAVPNGRAEVLFLRAMVALRNVPKPAPGPFAPGTVAWMPLELPPSRYLDWLPIATDEPSHVYHETAQVPVLTDRSSTRHSSSEQAEELVVQALTVAPDHPSAHQLRLAIANLAFMSGRTTEACRLYQRLHDDGSSSVVTTLACYNLGLCHLKSWALPSAQTAFLDVADSDPKGRFNSLGWWWIGRIELERGDTAAARKAWERIDVQTERETGSAAGLGDVLTYLLDDAPEQAFLHLRRCKPVSAHPHPELAEAFECLMRYSNSASVGRGESLALAAQQADYGRAFGPAGEYLFARFLRQIGREEEALRLNEMAIETAHGQWAIRMAFDSAEYLLRTKHTTRAKTRLETVAAADTGEVGDRARFLLAEIAVRNSDGKTCVINCRNLLDHGTVDRDDVLRLMGRGYELLGRKSSAAECFAGRVPSRDVVSVSTEIRR